MNVSGYGQLIEGHPIQGVYTMFNEAFRHSSANVGWFIIILFVCFEVMLYIKTENSKLTVACAFVFLALYGLSSFVEQASLSIMMLMCILLLAGIMYTWVMK